MVGSLRVSQRGGTGTSRDRAKGNSLDGGEVNVVKLSEHAHTLEAHLRAIPRRLVVFTAAI